jgi:predicted RNase H-like HicB family nuclease
MSALDRYLALNYHKRLYQDDEGDWIVEVDDLPGCIADGKTPDEAVESSREAMRSWMESRMSSGLDIPEPSIADSYSGRILLRMPKYIHRRLAILAQQEGSSLNQYIVSLLSYGCAQFGSGQLQTVSSTVSSMDEPLSRVDDLARNAAATSDAQGVEAPWVDEVLAGFSGTSTSRQAYGASQGGRA